MQFEKFNLTSTIYMYNGISIILVLNFNNFEMWVFLNSMICEYISISLKLCFFEKIIVKYY